MWHGCECGIFIIISFHINVILLELHSWLSKLTIEQNETIGKDITPPPIKGTAQM